MLALYRSEAAAILLASAQSGERSIVRAVAGLPMVRMSESELRKVDPELNSFRNLNTPEEWDLAEKTIPSY